MDGEEVFNNLSVGFSDIVNKIRISKTKIKNSGSYKKLWIQNNDLKSSVVTLLQSDYYYELKRHCLQFSHKDFPFGIQAVFLYMKQTKNVRFFVAPPGNAFAQARKSNEFIYAGGMSKYNIEYSLRYSLDLDSIVVKHANIAYIGADNF